MEEDFNIKVTRLYQQAHICNSMCNNYYYVCKGRILNKENTKYRPFAFIVFFDGDDLYNWYYDEDKDEEHQKDYYSKKDIRDYASILASSYLENIKSYNDCKDFYNLCAETIDNYNRICD